MTRTTKAGSTRPRGAVAVRTAVAALSALVLLVVGVAWGNFGGSGLSTANTLRREKGADGSVDVLLVGMDSRTDAHGNPIPQSVLNMLRAGQNSGESNTDTLVLLHIPNDHRKRPSAISIPRDSYVSIPGHGRHKINSAYARFAADARQRYEQHGQFGPAITQQAKQTGRVGLIRTVQQLTGITIDHYAEVNLLGFADITSAVGGVRVCLKAPVDDPYSGAHFRAGWQTLNGVQALRFVRQRHGLPRGDLDRIRRQQAFMAGLVNRVLSTGTLTNPTRLAQLSHAVQNSLVLDKGWNLLGFAQQMQGLTSDRIRFATIPTESLALHTPHDGVAVQVKPSAVRQFVAALTSSDAPAPGSDQHGTAGPAKTPSSGTSHHTGGAAASRPTSPAPPHTAPPASSTRTQGCVN